MTSSARLANRVGTANGGSRKFTSDIIKQLKELTAGDAGDEEVQMALQECNGDVNRAAMSLLENPFQEVKVKKIKPKVTEKPPPRSQPRDFSKKEYTRDRDNDRAGGRGRGRDSDRNRGRGGRGRGARGQKDEEVPQPLAIGNRPADIQENSDTSVQLVAEATPDEQAAQIVGPPAPVAPPSPVRPVASAIGGGSWASKLKESTAPQVPVRPAESHEPEPVHHELLTSAETGHLLNSPENGWGIPDAAAGGGDEPHTEDHDAFGNGFGHDAENNGPSWGPPAPGDGSAQWGPATDLPATSMEDTVAKPYEATPPGMPGNVPTPTYHTAQQPFDLSGMASTLQGNYGADKNFANFGLSKEATNQPNASAAYKPTSMSGPQPGSMDYSNFAQAFVEPPPEVADDKVDVTAGYTTQVPGFPPYTQQQSYMNSEHAPYLPDSRDLKQQMSGYGNHDGKKDDFGLQHSQTEKPEAQEQSKDDQPHSQMPHSHHHLQQQDMPYGMMPAPDMYNVQAQRPGNAQQLSPQPGMMQPLGMQQSQAQQQPQMAGFMPQQPGMTGYPGSYPNMQYGSQMGYQQPYMQPYSNMAYPGFAQYPGYPQQAQSYNPAQGQQQPYAAAQVAYTSTGAKPAYDANFGGVAGGRNGGRRGKKANFGGRGGAAGTPSHTLPTEPFNPTQASTGTGAYAYPDANQWAGNNPRFDGGSGFKQDKTGVTPVQAQQQPQQFDQTAYMQQQQQQQHHNFQQYGGSFQGQQFPQYSQQPWGGQDKTGYGKQF